MANNKKGGLGRGLDALFKDAPDFDPAPVSIQKNAANSSKIKASQSSRGEGAKPAKAKADTNANGITYIKITDIKPNSKQPRKTFDEEKLEELSQSIKENGVIQPVTVRKTGVGYELVMGERRWRAARKAGLKEIPAIVRELDEKQLAVFALIENMQREDLNIIEEALGIEKMINDFGLTQEEAANSLKKSRPYVTNALRLLKLPAAVQELVVSKQLSAGHARAIAGLPGEKLQLEAAELAVKEGWSVRKIENYTGTKTPAARKKKKPAAAKKSPEIKAVENELSETLSARVSIDGNDRCGKLIIEYFSRSELERMIELLKGE